MGYVILTRGPGKILGFGVKMTYPPHHPAKLENFNCMKGLWIDEVLQSQDAIQRCLLDISGRCNATIFDACIAASCIYHLRYKYCWRLHHILEFLRPLNIYPYLEKPVIFGSYLLENRKPTDFALCVSIGKNVGDQSLLLKHDWGLLCV